MINSNLNVPTIIRPAVRVTSLEDTSKFTISWDAQPESDGYRVYAGFDPFYIKSLISSPTPITATSFDYELPFLPPSQIVYFWVGSVKTGVTTFLDEMGSNYIRTTQYDSMYSDPFSDTSKMIICPCDQLYYIEEMRRRSKAILEDVGEEVDVFIKQWTGLPDPTTQEELGLDPNYQAMTRNDNTYGVGFYPGYFPAVRVRMRFGGLPQAQLDYQVLGLRPLLANETWTLWDPILHENDLIVRPSTGQRYVVKVNAFSNYRTVPITQRMTLELVNPTSPLQKVTDADVRQKWGNLDGLGYARIGFNVMPPTNADAKDYLLF